MTSLSEGYADQRSLVHNEVLLEQPPVCPKCHGDLDFDGIRMFCPDCGWITETREMQR